jgi:hypothetical protein
VFDQLHLEVLDRLGLPASGPYQAGLVGQYHGLDAVAKLELGQQVGHLALDGGVAGEQLRGDLGVGQPPGDELEDLQLPGGEPHKRVGATGTWEPGELLDDPAYLPTRLWAEVTWAAVLGQPSALGDWLGLLAYAAGFAVLALWGYRRDEGTSYR